MEVTREVGHVSNMGGMMETMESAMRGTLESIYIAKTREVVAALRCARVLAAPCARGSGITALAYVRVRACVRARRKRDVEVGGVSRAAFTSDLSAAVRKAAHERPSDPLA